MDGPSVSSAPPVEEKAFHERLWPSPGYWVVVPLLGVMVAVSLLPVSGALALGGAAVVMALVAAGLVTMSPVLAVTRGELRAGPARVPVALLGEPSAHRTEDARHERGPGLDARAFLVIRGWVSPVVRVPLRDPDDPTPYWLVSTRQPERLVEALEAARTR